MASESTSSQQSQQLLPSSKVNFRCKEGIIGFNNAIALCEHPNKLYRPMLSFLSNCCINKALTLQPTAMYVEYLKEFWYTTKVEEETKTITLSLSWCDKPLSFTQDEFRSAIGLPIYKDVVPLPLKETVRAGLVTLGLFDKDKPTLSSTVLVNSSPLKMKYFTPIWKLFMQYIIKCLGGMQGSHDQMNLNQQTIAYCLIWGLEIAIVAIIFSDLIHKLQNGKKHRELNICYTRFLSLIFEKLLGENYISNDLTLPKQSLIPPVGEVNADDTDDKSLYRASVQPVTQPKAPTDLKTKKKRIPPSSKPKSPYKVRVILPKKQVAETQHAEVTVATADATKSLVASELAEEQVNQPSAVEAEKKHTPYLKTLKNSRPLPDFEEYAVSTSVYTSSIRRTQEVRYTVPEVLDMPYPGGRIRLRYKEFGELIQPFKDPERVSQLVRKLLKTTAEKPSIRRIYASQYAISNLQNRNLFSESKKTNLPSPSHLNDDYRDELKETNGEKYLEAHYTNIEPLGKALPRKEKDPGCFTLPCFINNMCFNKALADLGASISVMPYSTYTTLGLGDLIPTKLIVELVDRTVK
ncbi:retrovirus-related pol polyprotein from transposon TNT 1-94 [Tanacetum coccineum]